MTIEVKEVLKNILYYFYKPLPDKLALKLAFPLRAGEKLELDNPKTFNQKLQWYKLFYRDPLMVQCADKYSVREYIKNKGYEHLLVPLYGAYENADEINFSELPNSFVLKTTNAMGTNIIVKDKSKINEDNIKKELNKWLKKTPLQIWFGREWAYEQIKPRIICEEFIDSNGEDLIDYKFHCFNGTPEVIQVSMERETNLKVNYYDTEWNSIKARQNYPNKTGIVEAPPKLKEMLKIAAEFAEDFPYVRVDFYNIKEKIIFGELTFYSSAGFSKFSPNDLNQYMGELFTLPTKIIL